MDYSTYSPEKVGMGGRGGRGSNYDIMKTDTKGQVKRNKEIITLLNFVFYEICLRYLRLHYWWVVGG